MEHWSKEFFGKTLPALVQANLLEYDCPHTRLAQHAHQAPRVRKKAGSNSSSSKPSASGVGGGGDDEGKEGNGNSTTTTTGAKATAKAATNATTTSASGASIKHKKPTTTAINVNMELGIGVVYLPFCYHVVKEIVAALRILSQYYDISFLSSSQLSEHALWRSTQDLPADLMQKVFGKQLNQEDLYCTFGPRDVFECMEDTRVSKVQVVEVLSRIEDFDQIRMIKCQALRPNQQQQRNRGGFVGLLPHAQCAKRGFLQCMGMDHDASFALSATASSSSLNKLKPSFMPISTARFLQQCLGKGGRIRRRAVPAPTTTAASTTTVAANGKRPARLAQQLKAQQKRKRANAKLLQKEDDRYYHYIFGPVRNMQTYLRLTTDPKKEKEEEEDKGDDRCRDSEDKAEEEEDDDDDEEDDEVENYRDCLCPGCSDENCQLAWASGLLWGAKFQQQVKDKYVEEIHDEEEKARIEKEAAAELARQKYNQRKRKGKRRKIEEPADANAKMEHEWMNSSRGTWFWLKCGDAT
jgi:hypothetical protein